MAEYVMEKLNADSTAFKVHELSCSEVNYTDNAVLYLGSYGNSQAPFAKANNLHSGVAYCADCLPQ